ncbi:carcinoembryonic antigen-related cell adhesion molecule 5-like isoform X2 [Carcharodon carcharias]|uniref:carcinoembryonic antigen-related cell adhesion molecule 5-like isoform X2 n=1 Tax=Carcharodon carcharias TaxID=13397 RepID=UPI001B7D9857|nr:carcinoembryonic antigen-related cell adhesion molecule 5-like isoform X2 [Carcharodon carcharias]
MDTIYSGTWRKMNTSVEIAECYLKPEDSQKVSTQELQGTCRLQDSSISFTLRNPIPGDAGTYCLKLVSEAGKMEHARFTAKLYESVSTPSINLNTGEIKVGANLTLICKIENGTDPQFNWQMVSRPLGNNTKHSISENGTILTITAITPSDCGSYKCLVKNEISQQEKHFNLSSDDYQWCQKERNYVATYVLVLLFIVSVSALIMVRMCRGNNNVTQGAGNNEQQGGNESQSATVAMINP